MQGKRGHKKLSKKTAHRKSWLEGLAKGLIEHGKIKTTRTRGKEVCCFIEKIITKAKKDTLASKRLVFSKIKSFPITKKIFEITDKQFKERKGGYTRVINIGPRRGDAAPMVIVELVK